MRHRADKNQQDIVDELRDLGISVLILSQVGGGCPDLLIGHRGKNYLIEVKTFDCILGCILDYKPAAP